MHRLNKNLCQQSVKSNSKLSKTSSSDQKQSQPLMERLWLKLYEIYENKAKVLGEINGDVFEAWASYLGKVSPDQIKYGLEMCMQREDEWPPAIQAFYQMCLSRPDESLHKEYKRLPVIKATPESCKEARAKALKAAGVKK